MEKQISIIIPTYNMEAYIGKCLDSLLIPEIDEVEVLVMNDGSKDRSSEIAHGYAERYPGSIRVIDKANGNYGSCINAALPLATGRYIKILDADDTFDSSEFSKLVKSLREINDDAVISNYSTVSIFDELIKKTQHPVSIDLNVSIDVLTARRDAINCYIDMHRLAYNKDVFSRFEYIQSEGISYTDAQWVMFPLSYCKTFRCLDLTVYKYLLGRDGQTMSNGQMARSLNNLFSMLKDSIVILNKTQDQFAAEYIQQLIIGRINYIYQMALLYISENTMRIWSEFDNWLLENSPILYEKVNDLYYSKLVKNYRIFADIRKKNFPADYKLPLYVRGLIFLKSKLLK